MEINIIFNYYIFTDINECVEGTSGCTQNCTNTVGSFQCFCKKGYMLSEDKRTCNGECYDY